MKLHDFMALDSQQQHVIVLSMVVRNAMEDFHVTNLSDPQIKELNQIIRYALFDAVDLLESMDGDPDKEAFFSYLVGMIPDYWEVPGRDEFDHPGRVSSAA